MSAVDYHALKRKELQALARAAGITGLNQKNEALIEALEALDSDRQEKQPELEEAVQVNPSEQNERIKTLEDEVSQLKTLLKAMTTRLEALESKECQRCLERLESTELPRSPSPLPSPKLTNLPKSFSVNSSLSAWRKPLESTPARQYDMPQATASIFKKTNPFSYGSNTPAKSALTPARTYTKTPAASMKTLYGTEWKGGQENRRASSSASAWASWR